MIEFKKYPPATLVRLSEDDKIISEWVELIKTSLEPINFNNIIWFPTALISKQDKYKLEKELPEAIALLESWGLIELDHANRYVKTTLFKDVVRNGGWYFYKYNSENKIQPSFSLSEDLLKKSLKPTISHQDIIENNTPKENPAHTNIQTVAWSILGVKWTIVNTLATIIGIFVMIIIAIWAVNR